MVIMTKVRTEWLIDVSLMQRSINDSNSARFDHNVLLRVKQLILIEMKQSLNDYITEMRHPTDLIIVQTTDFFIHSLIFTCGDFL